MVSENINVADETPDSLQTISAPYTFAFKFLFPTVWIAGFSLMTLSLFLDPGSLGGHSPLAKWVFLVGTVAGIALIRAAVVPLRRVRMDTKSLYVSNYHKEIVVPLADVVSVRFNYARGGAITVALRSPTELGEQVTFLWKRRSRPPFVIDELRAAVAKAQTRAAWPKADPSV